MNPNINRVEELLVKLGIKTHLNDLQDEVVESACDAYGNGGLQMIREKLSNARADGGYTYAYVGRTLSVKHTTVMSWFGTRVGDLSINNYLQVCLILGKEPAALVPAASDLENELIQAGMNVVNQASAQRALPLKAGQYPKDAVSCDRHWGMVEELTLRLLNMAVGDELSDLRIITDVDK